MCCDELTADSSFCVVYDVAADATGASDIGATGVMDLTSRVAGKGINIVSSTLLVIGVSGLMESG